jgi:hypothetical protein
MMRPARFALLIFACLLLLPSATADIGPNVRVILSEPLCGGILTEEQCKQVYDTLDPDGILCPTSGGGLGEPFVPVAVNPFRKSITTAGNTLTALPGDYSGYNGYQIVC